MKISLKRWRRREFSPKAANEMSCFHLYIFGTTPKLFSCSSHVVESVRRIMYYISLDSVVFDSMHGHDRKSYRTAISIIVNHRLAGLCIDLCEEHENATDLRIYYGFELYSVFNGFCLNEPKQHRYQCYHCKNTNKSALYYIVWLLLLSL